MSRRLTRTAMVALATLAFGLTMTACGDSGPSAEEQAAERQALARWQTGIAGWSADMVGALNGISVLLAHSESVDLLKSGEPRTTRQLARFERTLSGCTREIVRLGPAPEALTAVRHDALGVCRSLEKGARLTRDGVGAWRNGAGVGALNRAYGELGNGQRGLTRVRARRRRR